MACQEELVQYIAEQCSDAGEITVRRMFGEYGIYCDGKIFGLICDNELFIKITDAGKKLLPHLETAAPYDGAKKHFLCTDVEDRALLSAFVRATCAELPAPRAKSSPYDFKKEEKVFYQPPKKPTIVTLPPRSYLAVRGKGDPNEPNGAYQSAVGMLYAVAYTLKMSEKSSRRIEGFFPYVVPPLEGLWWQVDYSCKEDFHWISLLRLPDFIKEDDVLWAVKEAERKKKCDHSKVEFFSYDEGLCVQCMHVGSHDSEVQTVAAMESFLAKHGYVTDFSAHRYHHEIYLCDPRKMPPEKCKTVVRQPIKKADL